MQARKWQVQWSRIELRSACKKKGKATECMVLCNGSEKVVTSSNGYRCDRRRRETIGSIRWTGNTVFKYVRHMSSLCDFLASETTTARKHSGWSDFNWRFSQLQKQNGGHNVLESLSRQDSKVPRVFLHMNRLYQDHARNPQPLDLAIKCTLLPFKLAPIFALHSLL